jgi:hypothetical protein
LHTTSVPESIEADWYPHLESPLNPPEGDLGGFLRMIVVLCKDVVKSKTPVVGKEFALIKIVRLKHY